MLRLGEKRALGLNPSAQQCFESISRGVEVEGLTGERVESVGNLVELGLGDVAEAGALREVLPEQPVGVLVRAALPGAGRVGEVDLQPGPLSEPLPT